MVPVPRLSEQIKRVVAVDPAEQFVQLGGNEELAVGHHLEQPELGLGQSQHLVADEGQPVVVVGMLLLDEFEAGRKQSVEGGIVRNVQDLTVEEGLLPLERALTANHNHLEVRILEKVGQPQLGIESDLLEKFFVEEIKNDAVARQLQEALERTLKRGRRRASRQVRNKLFLRSVQPTVIP